MGARPPRAQFSVPSRKTVGRAKKYSAEILPSPPEERNARRVPAHLIPMPRDNRYSVREFTSPHPSPLPWEREPRISPSSQTSAPVGPRDRRRFSLPMNLGVGTARPHPACGDEPSPPRFRGSKREVSFRGILSMNLHEDSGRSGDGNKPGNGSQSPFRPESPWTPTGSWGGPGEGKGRFPERNDLFREMVRRACSPKFSEFDSEVLEVSRFSSAACKCVFGAGTARPREMDGRSIGHLLVAEYQAPECDRAAGLCGCGDVPSPPPLHRSGLTPSLPRLYFP